MNLSPTVKALLTGLVAALAVLYAGWQAGEGISTGEYISAVLAFLAAAFGITTVQTNRELRAEKLRTDQRIKAVIDDRIATESMIRRDVATSAEVQALDARLGEVEDGLAGMQSEAGRRTE